MYKLVTSIAVAFGTVVLFTGAALALPDCPGGGKRTCTFKCTGLFPPKCEEVEPCTCAIVGGTGGKAQQTKQTRWPGLKDQLQLAPGGAAAGSKNAVAPRGPALQAPPAVAPAFKSPAFKATPGTFK